MSITTPRINEIAPGLFNIRAPFKLLGGLLNLGTHMNLIRLESGHFVALSTIPLTPDLKSEVDKLTSNGTLLDAVLGTNPYHTIYFQEWFAAYPGVKFYGTPRHVRVFPDIKWEEEGTTGDEVVLNKWAPEIELRIPEGCEFVNPLPESINHFSGVIAFHRASRTIISDDAFHISANPKFVEKAFLGHHKNEISFHLSLIKYALHKTPDASKAFYDWVLKIVEDWDFDNIASAHGGYAIGGAKKQLVVCLEKSKKSLVDFAIANGGAAF
ncbi:hypothetical protein HK100_010076 [Physocladia obscura]|uniref:DUF4336 domain-containing protein n=1 Tax=Physocladia obscura TaxID=109957 RepID=A0AAD5SLG9_9FUNG|nr:hypothetical protein HK100_010076 [Physocladia obscura]